MKFMLLLKGDRSTDTSAAPSAELVTAMTAFNDALTTAGALLEANGLQPTSEGFMVVNDGGEISTRSGPFTESFVLLGYWLIQVASRDDALDWAGRIPFETGNNEHDGDGNGFVEVRQVYELDDFPVAENESGWREEEAALRAEPLKVTPSPGRDRYLMMFRADQQSEAGELPDEAMLTEMGGFIGELAEAGVWIAGEGLHPSSHGARVQYRAGERSIIDGPFAETKELVAGYGVVEVTSREQVEEICLRGAKINGNGLSEIRKLV